MKNIVLSTLILLLIVILTVPVLGDSMWTDEAESMYQDRASFSEGDIITIKIEERSTALQSANMNTSQSSQLDIESQMGVFDFLGSILFGYSEDDSADGETGREGTIEADITTQVQEVQENGNLELEGTKNLTINEEEQLIALTGIIRPEDVDRDNVVSSERVAEASIEYKGEGPIAEKQRPGLFSRLFNWLF